MTIIEAITRVDALKPNVYKQSEKIAWLSSLDAFIKTTIVDTHKGGEEISFSDYDESTPLTTELIVPSPYDELYLFWLEAKIDYYDREFKKYNNTMAMYQAALEKFESYYVRTHMPIGKRRFLF